MADDANAGRLGGAALPAPTLLVRLLLPAIYLCCAFAFVTDVTYDNSLAFGIAYVPGICTAVAYRRASAVWWLTGLAILLVAIGYFFPVVNADIVDSLGNRMLSLGAILVTAALVRYSRHIQEQLAEQTARVKAAERAKTDLFTNLSQEIRTPLHSIIGFAELMTVNCRPDQKAPLAQMQIGGKRLLATIDNLVDLTMIDGRALRREPVALQPILRDVVAAAQTWAAERDVTLSLQETGPPLVVETDAWAVRRIVENLLSNALKFTQRGGTVVLRLAPHDARATIEVDDTGVGLAPEMHDLLQVPMAHPEVAPGAGLLLSRRLAAAIGATLQFESERGRGTLVRLSLPA